MILRKVILRLNNMNLPEFRLAKVKEMHNGVVRVKGNANSINLLRMEGGLAGVFLGGFCALAGIFTFFSELNNNDSGLFESARVGLGVFLFFLAFILFLLG